MFIKIEMKFKHLHYLKDYILPRTTNTFSCLSLKWQAHFIHFQENFFQITRNLIVKLCVMKKDPSLQVSGYTSALLEDNHITWLTENQMMQGSNFVTWFKKHKFKAKFCSLLFYQRSFEVILLFANCQGSRTKPPQQNDSFSPLVWMATNRQRQILSGFFKN